MSGGGSNSGWWQALRWDPMPWLLDPQRPNLMWRVLVDVVGRPRESPAVIRARGGADAQPPVSELLAGLQPGGEQRRRVTRWHHFSGLAWRVTAAVQLGADPSDPRLQGAALRLMNTGHEGTLAPEGEALPCATARVVAALAGLGFGGELRFSEALAWLATLPRAARGGWRCDRHRGDGGCEVTAAALLAAAESAPAVGGRGLVERAADSLLDGGLSRLAVQLGWPNLLRADLAEALAALARAGVPFDSRMKVALGRLQQLQDDRGRWLATAHPPRSLSLGADLAADGWVTLHAVTAMARYAEAAGLPRMYPERPGAGS